MIALSIAPVAAQQIIPVAAPQDESVKPGEKNLMPEQKMTSRHPQPVRAGFLVGLPTLGEGNTTPGYIQQVVRSA